MKPSKRIAAFTSVLRHRSNAMRAQMASEQRVLTDIEREMNGHVEAIARLREELAASLTPSGPLHRGVLMRIRGKQAVGRFQIACHRLEIAELEARRSQSEQSLSTSQRAAATLERRQRKHQVWMRQVRKHRLLQQDRRTETDTMERIGYEFNR
ncbi:BsaT protein (plasmid) [Burkholderia pyrrocinia]|uniref:BsaT protein n=1 Tax=Burkholderia pyrrocinia TaxID=60550 RepID=UPI0038B55C61